MHTKETIKNYKINIPAQPSPLLTGKMELTLLRLMVFVQLFRIVLLKTGNAFKAVKSIYQVKRKYKSVFGEVFLGKAAKVDGRYFWRLAAPGFPSKASWDMQSHEVNRFFPNQRRKGLRSLLISITNRCSLNCEHCFEWENLNKEERNIDSG